MIDIFKSVCVAIAISGRPSFSTTFSPDMHWTRRNMSWISCPNFLQIIFCAGGTKVKVLNWIKSFLVSKIVYCMLLQCPLHMHSQYSIHLINSLHIQMSADLSNTESKWRELQSIVARKTSFIYTGVFHSRKCWEFDCFIQIMNIRPTYLPDYWI